MLAGDGRSENDNPGAQSGVWGSALVLPLSPPALPFCFSPSAPPPRASHARAGPSLPFSPKLEKKQLTGALNLRAGGLLAGGLGAGAAAGAASYLVKFVLPSEWTQAPGATGGPPASLARSASPRLALPRSLPARRLPRAPARVLRLPLQPHSNMASSLCACPALFFKIIILCVCSELLQRPFPALAERLKPISLRDAPDSFLCPAVTPPRLGTHTPLPKHTHKGTFHAHTAPSPPRSPSSFSSAPSIHNLQKVHITGVSANPSAGKSGQTPHLTGHLVFWVCNPLADEGHKLALYPPVAGLERGEIQSSSPPLPRPLRPPPPGT